MVGCVVLRKTEIWRMGLCPSSHHRYYAGLLRRLVACRIIVILYTREKQGDHLLFPACRSR